MSAGAAAPAGPTTKRMSSSATAPPCGRRWGGGFYSGAAARAALSRFCELQEAYLNFVRPIRKVARTVRDGARVTRARTPWRRLLARPGLGDAARDALAGGAARIDALALQRELDEAKSAFWELDQPR